MNSSGGSFTQTGVNEMRQAVHKLPAAVTAGLREVAKASAHRILANARANLARQTHGTGATAKAIVIEEDAANREFRVISVGAPHPRFSLHRMKRSGRTHTQRVTQNNLPMWLEYGTSKMAARPYMHPAAAAEVRNYRVACEVVSAKAVSDLLQ